MNSTKEKAILCLFQSCQKTSLSFQIVMGVFKSYVLICPVWAICSVSLYLFYDLLGVSLLNLRKVLWTFADEDPHRNLQFQSFILKVFQGDSCTCVFYWAEYLQHLSHNKYFFKTEVLVYLCPLGISSTVIAAILSTFFSSTNLVPRES